MYNYLEDNTIDLEELNEKVDNLEFKESYTNMKTRNKLGYQKYILLPVIGVLLFICLVFLTDTVVSVDDADIACVSAVNTVRRESVVEVTQAVQTEQIEETVDDINNLYGKLAPDSLKTVDAEYYDCRVPFELRISEIGGLQVETEYDHGHAYPKAPDYVKDYYVGDYVNYYTNNTMGILQRDPETGCNVYIDSNGNKRYATAIQKYFYPAEYTYYGTKDPVEDIQNWNGGIVGQLFDIILDDDTVIPMIVCDANSAIHTNNNAWKVNDNFWKCSEIFKPEYEYLFSCFAGNCLELNGVNATCASKFREKFGIKTDGTGKHIKYYRMYKKDVVE